MTHNDVPGRTILTVETADFRPYDLYGDPVPGIFWKPINFDSQAVRGSFLVRLDPGTKSLPHIHTGGEDSYIVAGELVDGDGRVFGPGSIVSYGAGSRHASQSPRGCTILVYLHGPNRAIDADDT